MDIARERSFCEDQYHRYLVGDCDGSGPIRYRLLDRNCEHLARWVLTGKARSTQVREVATALAMGKTLHPPFGVFHLDPATFHVMGHGGFDADGRASLNVSLPPELDVVGLDLYWQASIRGRRRFSNVERTTLTDL